MRRTEVIRAVASKAEKRALRDIAYREDRTPSDMLRQLVRERAQEMGLWPFDASDGVRERDWEDWDG